MINNEVQHILFEKVIMCGVIICGAVNMKEESNAKDRWKGEPEIENQHVATIETVNRTIRGRYMDTVEYIIYLLQSCLVATS